MYHSADKQSRIKGLEDVQTKAGDFEENTRELGLSIIKVREMSPRAVCATPDCLGDMI